MCTSLAPWLSAGCPCVGSHTLCLLPQTVPDHRHGLLVVPGIQDIQGATSELAGLRRPEGAVTHTMHVCPSKLLGGYSLCSALLPLFSTTRSYPSVFLLYHILLCCHQCYAAFVSTEGAAVQLRFRSALFVVPSLSRFYDYRSSLTQARLVCYYLDPRGREVGIWKTHLTIRRFIDDDVVSSRLT